ncbi:hypothetical protein [Streptomyces sp. T028]|uniref:hypothetical protein n=1 Tax=Streptomyces sp. T028 TaxID=3394379 RepID=UPI003A8C255D
MAFSADGRTLATGGEDGTVQLRDPGTGRSRGSLPGNVSAVTALPPGHGPGFEVRRPSGDTRRRRSTTWAGRRDSPRARCTTTSPPRRTSSSRSSPG